MRTVPNPYPEKDSWNKITKFEYTDCLCLKRFPQAVRVHHDPDLDIDAEFVVAEPYSISYSLDQGTKRTITVPQGFLSDGVSVFGNNSDTRQYLEASIIHDYLYVAWQYLEPPHERKARKWDQKFADKLFHIALLKSDVGVADAWLMYKAVRSFGWSQYKEKDPVTFMDV
jgi:hypothetical protein